MIYYIINMAAGNEMGRLLPKQLNADKEVNVDQGFQRISGWPKSSQSDVKVVSSEANSAVGSIWKKNSPRNPQIHKSPSKSDDLPSAGLIDTPQTIPEGRVVNIDEAIACRNSTHLEYSNNNDDITIRHANGKLDHHGDNYRNHRLVGDALLLDHHLGVAINSSNSSLGTASSEEHVFNKNYLDSNWDQLRHKKFSPPTTVDSLTADVTNDTRAQSVTSSYSTHLESDL